MEMTMLPMVGLKKSSFKKSGSGCYVAKFVVDKPIEILNAKRPDLPIHLQMGRVGYYAEGLGFGEGYLQGTGKNDNGYGYSLIV